MRRPALAGAEINYDRTVVGYDSAHVDGLSLQYSTYALAFGHDRPIETVGAQLSEASVSGDYVNVVAAILGAGLGLFLAHRLGVFRGRGEERDPVPAEPLLPTGYVSSHQPSAAPILGALGATFLGVGLAIASSLGGFSLALVIAGAALLAAALLTAVRRGSGTVGR